LNLAQKHLDTYSVIHLMKALRNGMATFIFSPDKFSTLSN